MLNVEIVMSTFNGAKFLREQLESLLAQDYRYWTLRVRDDGSTDDTTQILAEYAARHPERITWTAGKNLGVVASFFALLGAGDADFTALADQDDVWMPSKLSRAVHALTRFAVDEPALYCSRQRLVDAQLRPLGDSQAFRRSGFVHSLFENKVTGCTTMLNRAGRELVVQSMPPQLGAIYMHDWWLYQVLSAFGHVVFDREPTILYRQHGGNVLGYTNSRLNKTRRKLDRFLFNPELFYRIHGQAALFERCFASRLKKSQRRQLERFLRSRRTRWNRYTYALFGPVHRESVGEAFAVRLLIALNRY